MVVVRCFFCLPALFFGCTPNHAKHVGLATRTWYIFVTIVLSLLSVSTTVELVVNQMDWARGMLIGHTGSNRDSGSGSESSNESSSTSSPVVLFRHVSIEWSPVSDTSSSLFPFTFDLLDGNRRALHYEHLQWYQISETEKKSSGKEKPKRKADSGSDRKSTKKRKGKGNGAMSKQ